ncbi:MAG: hypothetical protein C4321_09420 [Chloroflexota bacterium]
MRERGVQASGYSGARRSGVLVVDHSICLRMFHVKHRGDIGPVATPERLNTLLSNPMTQARRLDKARGISQTVAGDRIADGFDEES